MRSAKAWHATPATRVTRTSRTRRALVTGALAWAALASGLAHAGRACDDTALPSPEKAVLAMQMAELTTSALSSLPDEVVLLGRVGQDISKYGLKYSHMAFAVRNEGAWQVVHELNECGTAHSAIFEQGLLEFFSDNPFKYEAGAWRLEPEVQARLKGALAGKKSLDYHEPRYNMLAYPFSEKYQNSNGWILEVLAYGLAPPDEANTRKTAQQWLAGTGYRPSTLDIGAMTRLGARVTKANIAFDDHPSDLRWADKINTVTVTSVIDFLRSQLHGCADKGCPVIQVTLPDAPPGSASPP